MIILSNKQYKRLIKLAYHDHLTGCYNRNWYFKHLNDSDEFMFIVVDINNLKTINDSSGHLFGDMYIKEIAKHLMKFGKVIRFGGDEFIMIVDIGFDPKQLDDTRYCYGFSIKHKYESIQAVLDKADVWLYKSKGKKEVRNG